MPRLTLALLLVALCSGVVHAGDVSAQPARISLHEAIAIALRDNRALKAAGYGREAALDEVGAARGALLPRLDALENFSYTDNPLMVFSDLLVQQDFSQSDFERIVDVYMINKRRVFAYSAIATSVVLILTNASEVPNQIRNLLIIEFAAKGRHLRRQTNCSAAVLDHQKKRGA
jgi:hypothetical protein